MAGPVGIDTSPALAGAEPVAARARPWWRRDRHVVTAAVVLTVLPLLVAVPRVLSKGAFALHGDDALVELRVRDIGSHTPLVGSYQRFGYNQPGPSLFYLLVLPYRLLGSRFAGLQVAALLTNAVAIVGIAVVAFRRGGTVLAGWVARADHAPRRTAHRPDAPRLHAVGPRSERPGTNDDHERLM